jgi:SAM-dependent methyltransferase
MKPNPYSPIRIYRADPSDGDNTQNTDLVAAATTLAEQELLRFAPSRPGHRLLEPFSRNWFEELEAKRYAHQGTWLRRVLEFTRHHSESMLLLGPGVGTDALQYQRHGTDVTICVTPDDPTDLIRRNFELRGLSVKLIHTGPEATLPFAESTFDLAYMNLLFRAPEQLNQLVDQVYRILKPGGKVFVLAPARYDVGFWERLLMPHRAWYRPSQELTSAPKHSRFSLKLLFNQYEEHRICKRHLRRSELPYLWRFVPLSILERLVGRVVVMRAFKPVQAALQTKSHTHAA